MFWAVTSRNPPGVAGVPAIKLLRPFLARQDNLVGIHNDDVIAGINVGRVEGFVLAAKNFGDLAGEAAQDFVLRIDDVPIGNDVFLADGDCLHGCNSVP